MKFLALLAAFAFLALAGCSGTGYTTPAMDSEGRYVIHLTAANKFNPIKAQVPVGATVVWVNDGSVHDVTADDGSWSSDDLGAPGLGRKLSQGDEYALNFTAAATIYYHCDVHHGTMKGILKVG